MGANVGVLYKFLIILIIVQYNYGLSMEDVRVFLKKTSKNFMTFKFYPGTLWCGPGNISDDYDDLGYNQAVDKCCRQHDNCPDFIPARQSKHNLTNASPYSIVTCKCNEVFRNCLRSIRGVSSYILGYGYFNLLGPKCFKEDYPVITCKRYRWMLFRYRCREYVIDTTKSKMYQLFDVNSY